MPENSFACQPTSWELLLAFGETLFVLVLSWKTAEPRLRNNAKGLKETFQKAHQRFTDHIS
jgi:hypothetical protein